MKQILVVVDMQNDFIAGVLGTKEAQDIVDNVCEKIRAFDGEILVTLDTHESFPAGRAKAQGHRQHHLINRNAEQQAHGHSRSDPGNRHCLLPYVSVCTLPHRCDRIRDSGFFLRCAGLLDRQCRRGKDRQPSEKSCLIDKICTLPEMAACCTIKR